MIRASFAGSKDRLSAVDLTGHAGWSEAGTDVVCAAVTSAVQMAANGITEVLGVAMPVTVEENRVAFSLPANAGEAAAAFLEALLLHLEILSQQYENTITIHISEV